jgi:hypothetical protein
VVFSFFTIWCNSQHSFSWTQVVFSIPVSFCEVPNIDIWPVEIDFEPRSKVALLGGTHSSLERCLSRRKLQVKGWLSSCSIPDLGRIVDPMNASFFFVTWKKRNLWMCGKKLWCLDPKQEMDKFCHLQNPSSFGSVFPVTSSTNRDAPLRRKLPCGHVQLKCFCGTLSVPPFGESRNRDG